MANQTESTESEMEQDSDKDNLQRTKTDFPFIIPTLCAKQDWCDDLKALYYKTGNELDPDQLERVKALLNKHVSQFATSPKDLGRAKVVQHSIETGKAEPIRANYCPPPKPFKGDKQVKTKLLHP